MIRFILSQTRTVHWPQKKHSAMYLTNPSLQMPRHISQLVPQANPELPPLSGMLPPPAPTPAPAPVPSSHQESMSASFYMRELPTSVGLIPYDSAEGKFIFKHALSEGGLEAFFPLSQQFLTQEEPACELSQTFKCMMSKVTDSQTVQDIRLWDWNSMHDSECNEN